MNAHEGAPARPEGRPERRVAPFAPGARALVDAWLGRSGDGAAALALAAGDPLAAAVLGGPGMRALAESRLADALRWARSRPGSAAKGLVGAEALIAGGRVVAGIEELERLARRRDPAGTLALARRFHLLGDHARAMAAASRLPLHPAAALIGARSALVAGRAGSALASLHPFLGGEAEVVDPVQTGAIGAAAAAALARLGKTAALGAFARRLLSQGLVPPEMLPGLARVGWTAGRAAETRERLDREPGPWRDAALLELAILAGDPERAAAGAAAAGPLAEPSRGLLELLAGAKPRPGREGAVLAEARFIEIWRTHPTRWAPWVEAVKAAGDGVRIQDLAAGVLPPGDAPAPDLVLDDGALIDLIEPVPVPARPVDGEGIWVESVLCEGVGNGHDWPAGERRALLRGMRLAVSPDTARVRVAGPEAALGRAAEGRREIVIAPPGDPFWAGPLPERTWPAMRVVRADPDRGWAGAGARTAELAREIAGP